MIKKAYEEPREVEYIEFKGKENFFELIEVVGVNARLITKPSGREYLEHGNDNISFPVGTVFYRECNVDKEIAEWKPISKDRFLRLYSDIN